MNIQEFYKSIKSKFNRVTGDELEDEKFSIMAVDRILSQLAISMNNAKSWEDEAKERVRLLDIELRKNEAITAHLEQKKESFIDDAKHEFLELANQAIDIVGKLETLLGVVESNEFKQEYVDQLSEITGITYKPSDINDKPEGTTVDCIDLGSLYNMVEPNPVAEINTEVKVTTKSTNTPTNYINANELMKMAKEAKTREELETLLNELNVKLEEKKLSVSLECKKELQKEITKIRSKINYRKKKLK